MSVPVSDLGRHAYAYKCKRCGVVSPTLLLGKIHVYQEHGKSWKKARCYLRLISVCEAREACRG